MIMQWIVHSGWMNRNNCSLHESLQLWTVVPVQSVGQTRCCISYWFLIPGSLDAAGRWWARLPRWAAPSCRCNQGRCHGHEEAAKITETHCLNSRFGSCKTVTHSFIHSYACLSFYFIYNTAITWSTKTSHYMELHTSTMKVHACPYTP